MHIVQVLLDHRIGGAEKLAATLAAQWVERGDTTSVVLLDALAGASTAPLARLRRLRSALQKEAADLVVAHSALPNLYVRIAAPIGTPVASVLHSAQDDFVERGLRVAESVLHRRGVVVAVSDEQAETYRRRFPAARLTTIPNGIAPDLPRRPRRLPGEDRPLRLVTVARVAEQKRPELWQQIVRAAQGLPMTFVWYGPTDGAAAAELVRDHDASGAPGRFMGRSDDVGTVLAGADALLHTAQREASSIGLMEAAAVGLPIICAASVARTLPPGLSWAEFDDADGALDALRRLHDEYGSALSHAEGWQERIRSTASARRCADAYRELAARRWGRATKA